MRSLVSALFVTFLAVGANAQSVDQFQDPPDLVVVKQDWSKERINWERDPFGGPVENYDEMRARARNERRVEEAKRVGSAADVDRVKR
ncbi:MAG: hypothetical protein ACRD68_07820, partial [Pyrinomonadaceae bacterium]